MQCQCVCVQQTSLLHAPCVCFCFQEQCRCLSVCVWFKWDVWLERVGERERERAVYTKLKTGKQKKVSVWVVEQALGAMHMPYRVAVQPLSSFVDHCCTAVRECVSECVYMTGKWYSSSSLFDHHHQHWWALYWVHRADSHLYGGIQTAAADDAEGKKWRGTVRGERRPVGRRRCSGERKGMTFLLFLVLPLTLSLSFSSSLKRQSISAVESNADSSSFAVHSATHSGDADADIMWLDVIILRQPPTKVKEFSNWELL